MITTAPGSGFFSLSRMRPLSCPYFGLSAAIMVRLEASATKKVDITFFIVIVVLFLIHAAKVAN